MSRIPGIAKYRNWLNKKAQPEYFVNDILELGAFWTEALLTKQESGELFWARLYHIEPHQEEALNNLWQDFGFTLQDMNEPLIQKTAGLERVGEHLGFLSKYEPGIDLKSYLSKISNLKPDRAIPLILQVIKSLETIYSRGTAHFQLKPSNLIILPSGDMFVKNFGLYEMENLLGKQIGAQHYWDAAYFSPEHFGDQELTIASDIYSLGLILFEMVTGRQPFSGPYQDVMNAHLKSMPPNPQALNPEINIGLARVLQRMLAKRKNQRFGSFSELREALFMLLSPLNQVMFRPFTHTSDKDLDEAESKEFQSEFSKLKEHVLKGKSKEALPQLELLIRLFGVRAELKDVANELADMLNHDELETKTQTAKNYIKSGHPYQAMRVLEEVLTIHPFHKEAKGVFKKCQSLMDIRPLNALRPAIATDVLLNAAKKLRDEPALFALARVLLADPENQEALAALESLQGEQDPQEKRLEAVRLKRDSGQFTEALAMLDSLIAEFPQNHRAVNLRKQIAEQVHIMSSEKPISSGETIPIGIEDDIGTEFTVDMNGQPLLEEGILNVQIAIQNRQFDTARKELSELKAKFPGDHTLKELEERLHSALKKDFIKKTEKRLRQLIQNGNDEEADKLVNELLKEDPNHGFAKVILKKLEQKRDGLSASKTMYEQILELENQGKIEQALETMRKGIGKVPRTQQLLDLEKRLTDKHKTQSEVTWLLTESQTLISKGNLQMAGEKLHRILNMQPDHMEARELLDSIQKDNPFSTLEISSNSSTSSYPAYTPTKIYTPPSHSTQDSDPLPSLQPEIPPTPEAAPEHVEVTKKSTPASSSEPKKKKSLLIPILVAAVFVVAAGAVGLWFHRQSQQNEAWQLMFDEAKQAEESENWEEALTKWKALVQENPEYNDSLGRLRDLEERIKNRENQISDYLERARSYMEDGYFYDDSNQNAIAMLRKVFEIEPDNEEAKQVRQQILDTEIQTATNLLEDERVLEAREKYQIIQVIDPTFKNEVFEEKVKSWLDETLILPAMDQINAAIKRKKWDKALELSSQLREQIEPIPALDEAWQTVFDSLQADIQDEKLSKSRKLAKLDLMARIQPENADLLLERNELSRELNQAKIDKLVKRMEKAYKSRQLVTAGRRAKELLSLDSEHELARKRLNDVIGKLKRRAQSEADSHPSKAISTYRSLLQIEKMKAYRKEISRLETRLKHFNSSIERVHESMNKPYDELHKVVIKALDNSKGFENERDFSFIKNLKTGIEKEKTELNKLVDWEKQVRADTSVTYASILEKLSEAKGFEYGFSKQTLARLKAQYEDRIQNYTGNFTLVIKKAINLPSSRGILSRTPNAFAIVSIAGNTCQTDPIKSKNPQWNHVCQFRTDQPSSIGIIIKSKGSLKKISSLGSVTIPKIPLSGKDQQFTSSKGWTIVLDIRRAR